MWLEFGPKACLLTSGSGAHPDAWSCPGARAQHGTRPYSRPRLISPGWGPMRTCLFVLPSQPVAPMDARVRDAVPRSVLWVAGASLGHGGFQGCFHPSHMACVTVGVRAGPERSAVHVLPFPVGPRSSCAATVRCTAGSLRRSLGLGSLPGRVRPTTELPQRCLRTAAGKEPGKEQRVLPCYKECQPGIPKLALICPKVTLSHVKTFWDGGPERVHAA